MDSNFNIRKADVTDAKAIAKVHVDSWRTTYANIVPDDYLSNLSYESREQNWQKAIPNGGVFVAENNAGNIVGFASGGKERSGKYSGFEGELYAIYLLKEYQGKGIGRALVTAIVEEIKRKGWTSVLILVLKDNNACQFYETLGAKKLDTVDIHIAGKKLAEIVYGLEDI